MSSRKPGYLIGLALLAVILSLPQGITCFWLAMDGYQTHRWPQLVSFENWSRPVKRDLLNGEADCHGRFIKLAFHEWAYGKAHWRATALDPRTRQTTFISDSITSSSELYPAAFGDRLMLEGVREAYELVDGAAQPAVFVWPTWWGHKTERFLLDGNPALLKRTQTGINVQTPKDGAWNVTHEVVLPDPRDWSTKDDPPLTFVSPGVLQCISHAGRTHLFLYAGRSMMYREGLELRPLIDEPASALETSNHEPEIKPWTRVCINKYESREPEDYSFRGILLNDQPIALLVEHYHDGRMIGNFFRFDGMQWTQFAKESFPIGVDGFETLDGHEGRPAVVVVFTAIRTHVYEVDDAGVRLIPWKHSLGITSLQLFPLLIKYGTIFVVTSLLGTFLGIGVGLMMRKYTQAGYAFGTQQVTLASLSQRGVARLLDIGLVGLSTIVVGWILLREMDWIVFVEALVRGIDHPMKHVLVRAVWGLLCWLVIVDMALVFTQGRWGLTPGKWCYGLRTVRTTLRPCGFARSLAREVVLWVDACGFLCWTPGVLSVALTDCRQRLGDLVADTIVVNASSMKPLV